MSTLQTPYGNPYDPMDQTAGPKKTSGLAIASLIFSLLGCPFCGIPAFVGAILGLIGVLFIGRDGTRKGKGLAAVGLVLGLAFSALWAIAAVWIFSFGMYFSEGPAAALRTGLNGDVAGFKSAFFGAGASAPDDEAAQFLETLKSRYGVFSDGLVDPQSAGPRQLPSQTQGQMEVDYILHFSSGQVDSVVSVIVYDQKAGLMKKLVHIHVIDPDLGDLWYPASAASGAPGTNLPGTTSPTPGTTPATTSPAPASP